MRTIRFRAWDKTAKEMFEVSHIAFNMIAHRVDGKYEWHHLIGESFADKRYTDHCILMQFADLYDKNSKEICEGDIIRYVGVDGKVYVQACPALTFWHFWQETKDNATVEVIGDIYQTPALLEVA